MDNWRAAGAKRALTHFTTRALVGEGENDHGKKDKKSSNLGGLLTRNISSYSSVTNP